MTSASWVVSVAYRYRRSTRTSSSRKTSASRPAANGSPLAARLMASPRPSRLLPGATASVDRGAAGVARVAVDRGLPGPGGGAAGGLGGDPGARARVCPEAVRPGRAAGGGHRAVLGVRAAVLQLV